MKPRNRAIVLDCICTFIGLVMFAALDHPYRWVLTGMAGVLMVDAVVKVFASRLQASRWNNFARRLELPPRVIPQLKHLFSEPSVLETKKVDPKWWAKV